MSIKIRDAMPGDEPSIVRLVQELGGADYESPISEDYVTVCLTFPGSHVLLAEDGERAIGLLSYSVRPDLFHAADSCLIEELVVQGTERRRGVASALLSEVLRRAASLGCVEVSVTTLPENKAAQRLYRSHGLVDEAVFLEVHL